MYLFLSDYTRDLHKWYHNIHGKQINKKNLLWIIFTHGFSHKRLVVLNCNFLFFKVDWKISGMYKNKPIFECKITFCGLHFLCCSFIESTAHVAIFVFACMINNSADCPPPYSHMLCQTGFLLRKHLQALLLLMFIWRVVIVTIKLMIQLDIL